MTPIEDPGLWTLLAFAATIALAGVIHGTLGLGFPLVATPLLALFVDIRSAVLITLLPTAVVNVASILRGGGWRHSLGRYWPLAAYSVAGSAVGTTVLIGVDPAPMKLLLAGLILLYLAAEHLGRLRLSWVGTHPQRSMLLFGLLAGLSAGMTNVMVPILIIFALELGLAPTTMVQVFNMCFLAGKIAQIATFGAAGLLTGATLGLSSPLALLALLALAIGIAVRERIPAEAYRILVKRVLFVLALVLVIQFAAAAGPR